MSMASRRFFRSTSSSSTARCCSARPGTELVSAAINRSVLFEADDHNVAEGWSVIVKGMAGLLRTDERDRRG